MDRKTAQSLNALNRCFYAAQAASFSETRGAAWAGWQRLVPWLEALPDTPVEANGLASAILQPASRVAASSTPPHYTEKRRPQSLPPAARVDSHRALATPRAILDLGCGNGRFFEFLQNRMLRDFVYLGIDASAELLALAREKFAADARAHFAEADLFAEPWAASRAAAPPSPGASDGTQGNPWAHEAWDFLAVFGVMHHLPGFENRVAFLCEAARALRAGGLLAVTFWQFGKFERFGRKIVPWSVLGAAAPSKAQLEAGDFLLSWGSSHDALRYCHFADEAELAHLRARLEAAGVHCQEAFSSDGETGDLNIYWLLTRAG